MYSLFSYESIASDHKAPRLFETPPGILITRTFRFFQYAQVPKFRFLKDWNNIWNRLVVQTKHHTFKLGLYKVFFRNSVNIFDYLKLN